MTWFGTTPPSAFGLPPLPGTAMKPQERAHRVFNAAAAKAAPGSARELK